MRKQPYFEPEQTMAARPTRTVSIRACDAGPGRTLTSMGMPRRQDRLVLKYQKQLTFALCSQGYLFPVRDVRLRTAYSTHPLLW